MVECSCCEFVEVNDLGDTFPAEHFRDNKVEYLKDGLEKRSNTMLKPIFESGHKLDSMLDIGCGVGTLHHDLIRRDLVQSAVGVDASTGAVEVAGELAQELGHEARASYFNADFAQNSDSFDSFDLVALDRVVCCYPEMLSLLEPAAARATKYMTLSFPVDYWIVRVLSKLINAGLWVTRSNYFPYLHRESDMVDVLQASGLTPISRTRVGLWRVLVLAR